MKQYNPKDLEPKWQKIWAETDLYKTDSSPEAEDFYQLTMFPYPSGDLHTGHWYALTAPDVLARFHRRNGKNVLFPMGWDAFGLPAENAAIKRGIPPAEWTRSNIDSMKKQLKRMGPSFDWSKELSTADPEYYRWTQRLFLLLYEQGLAYRQKGLQNWCPSCQTVLANEQVVGEEHLCERCDTPVEKKELEQWFFKITDYADELLEGLETVDWPDKVKTMQRNWIGKSQGAEINFPIDGKKQELAVFTTRPDTLFGATFMVLAPEHPLVEKITLPDHRQKVKQYVDKAIKQSDVERMEEDRSKTGVFTGAYARNPLNNQKIPIWVADYVLMGYGTGAIMAVPAHDQRDYEFASKYDLPVKIVIEPVTGEKQSNPQFRRSIVAVVENDQGELLSINWGEENGGNLFIGGGIEDGEDIIEAAKREILEETGYENVEYVRQSETVHHNYFAKAKNIPREIEATGLYFKLVDESRREQDLEDYEKDKFSVEWISKDQVENKVTDPLHKYVFDKLVLDKVYAGEGKLVGSGDFDGMDSSKAKEKITKALNSKGAGEVKTQYKLRDWLISRQRYWGAPIPIIYCESCGDVPVPEKDLPVLLPEDVEFEPTGQSPLLKRDDFVNADCPECGEPARREVDTMDTFVDSSWYYLRYPNPQYDQGMFDPEETDRWLPVDHYTGGIEHAILHLLYSRFITKFLRDHAGLGFDEPFRRLSNQGMILGPDSHKMSKSRGNVISPDEVIDSGYGADAFRTHMLFIGPWTEGGPFTTEGLAGTYRFLNRVWTLVQEYLQDSKAASDNIAEIETRLEMQQHRTVKKVTNDIDNLHFNTAIAALMEYTNALFKLKEELPPSPDNLTWKGGVESLLMLLAPFAPHITEELWSQLGYESSIHIEAWPQWSEELTQDSLVEVVIQINGKVRSQITVPSDIKDDELEELAANNERIKELLADQKVAKTIVVPGKLVNFVTG